MIRPLQYKKNVEAVAAAAKFVNHPPYIVGFQKQYSLCDPINVILNQGRPVDCYMTGWPSLAFWELTREDTTAMNSIIYDLVKKQRLCGPIKYLECNDYNFFAMDGLSRIYNNFGQEHLPSVPAIRSQVDDVRGKVCLKVIGISQSMCTDEIVGVIRVHQIKLEIMENNLSTTTTMTTTCMFS